MIKITKALNISQRLKLLFATLLFVSAQAIGAVAPFMPSSTAFAANNGTLKVHDVNSPSGTESNQPKVCAFNFEGFSFDASQSGFLSITVQGNDAPHGEDAGPFAFGPTNGSGYAVSQDFNNGPGTVGIKDGHYKVTLYGKDVNGNIDYNNDLKAKSKVFKVDCPEIQPDITTQASATNVAVGDTVYDTATLTGDYNHGDVEGTIDFYLCGPSLINPICIIGGTHISNNVPVVNGQAVSDSFTVTQAGKYCFRASFDAKTSSKYRDVTHTNRTTECFTATNRPQPKGSITIIKDVQPNSGQQFNFTTSGAGVSDFGLTDDGGNGNTRTFSGLSAGNYTITENAQAGWDFSDLSCQTSGGAIVNTGNKPSVSISLDGSVQNVVCTYVNKQRGQLVVHKVTDPANDPTSFSITASGSSSIAGATQSIKGGGTVTYDVSQGSYGVSEAATAGWHQDDSNCAQLTVTADSLVAECTIYNSKLAKLTIVKQTNPGKSTQKFTFNPSDNLSNSNFQLDTSQLTQTPSTKSFSNLVPGQEYSVEELAQTGWKLTGLTCTGLDYTWNNGQVLTVTLPAGANAICTFTNTKLGSISGNKFEVNALGIPVGTVSGVTIQLKKGDTVVATTVTGNNGAYSFNDLLPDEYNVMEVLTSGWTQIYGDSSVHLTAGDNDHRFFGNFKNATISGYKWSDRNGDGVKQPWEHKLHGWTMELYKNGNYVTSTNTNWQGNYEFEDLGPGIYKVCEVNKTGWVQTYPAFLDDCHHFIVFNSGETLTANFGNQARGNVTVNKVVVNDNGGQAVAQDFTLLVNGKTVDSGDVNEFTANKWYVVHESDPTAQGYQQTSLTCTNQWGWKLGHAFWLFPGEEVTCTITNDDIAPQLTVVKYVENQDTNLTKTSADFTMNVEGNNVSSTSFPGSDAGTVVSLNAGDYIVSEENESNYTASYSDDCTGTINIGESKTCYVTNTAIRDPQINVEKSGPDTAHAGDKVTYTFTVTNPGNIALSKVTVSDDIAGDGAVLQSGDVSNFGWLDPGETWIYTVDYTIPKGQTGSVVNTVTVCGSEDFWRELNVERDSILIEQPADPQQVCDSDTHTTKIPPVGRVLGSSTTSGELANTGQNPLVNVLAGLSIITLAIAVRWFGRREQTNTI